MDDQSLLDEYILNDVGKIWVGPMGTSKGREWVFGQFDETVLPACMLMLDRAELPYSQSVAILIVKYNVFEEKNNNKLLLRLIL